MGLILLAKMDMKPMGLYFTFVGVSGFSFLTKEFQEIFMELTWKRTVACIWTSRRMEYFGNVKDPSLIDIITPGIPSKYRSQGPLVFDFYLLNMTSSKDLSMQVALFLLVWCFSGFGSSNGPGSLRRMRGKDRGNLTRPWGWWFILLSNFQWRYFCLWPYFSWASMFYPCGHNLEANDPLPDPLLQVGCGLNHPRISGHRQKAR